MDSNLLDSDLTLLMSARKCFVAFAEWDYLEEMFWMFLMLWTEHLLINDDKTGDKK